MNSFLSPDCTQTSAAQRRIRQAEESDLRSILQVIAAAKGIMRASGNLEQWKGNYPDAEAIAADRAALGAYVMEEDSRIVAYFAFLPSPEPTYDYIEGAWLDRDAPYHVIHRIASLPEVHGIFSSLMQWAFGQDRNIRIDTHRDNAIMQHNLLKHGFSYCGIIYLADGDERLAYQRIAP